MAARKTKNLVINNKIKKIGKMKKCSHQNAELVIFSFKILGNSQDRFRWIWP
jgi:hypothetical protein